MEKDIITALLEWNPWFEEEMPSDLVGIPRAYDMLSYLKIPEIKILEGVRRSGKSTLLYQIVRDATEQGKKSLYINFDDTQLQQHSLSDIYHAFLQKSSVDYLLLDEVQSCEDWVPFVRKCYDRKQLEQIWITGSNSSLIKEEYADLLTGRNIKIDIAPLSFSEFLPFKDLGDLNLPISRTREAQVKTLFDNYLHNGAFPAIASRTVYQRELLNSYFDDFIYKDIASRHDVNIAKLKDLAIYCMTNATKPFSFRKIGEALGIHPNTVNDYITYMKDVFLFDEISKFDYSLKNQHRNDKKLYPIDTGLANAISFRFSEDKGRLLENTVYRHLKRLGHDVYFHRDKKECDFLVKKELEITHAIQVTCSLANPEKKQRELDGLIDAIKAHQPEQAMILTLDETDTFDINCEGKTYQVIVKPVWEWMLEV
ncbi:MAG: ATPase [marine bacterium B5-7]|nr:MAG: ATPase [marine bacterium B5-7]